MIVQSTIRSFIKRSLIALTLSCALLPAGLAWAELKVGDTVEPPTLRDANDKPAEIPDLGKKVLLILYTDPGVADITDKFADRVKALNLPEKYFRSVGVANMFDAKGLANWLIRIVVRGKIKKYNVTILTDPELMLKKQWSLGETDDKSVVLLIDQNRKVRYLHTNKKKKDELVGPEQDEAVKVVQDVVAEASGGTYTPQPSPTRN